MKILLTIFFYKVQYHFTKRKILFFLLPLLVIGIIVHMDVRAYKSSIAKEKNFEKLNYQHYDRLRADDELSSTVGLDFLFKESTLGILFKNTTISNELCANINKLNRIRIQNNLKGKSLSPVNLLFNFDFCWSILILFSLYSLYMGIDVFKSREYCRHLVSIVPVFKFYYSSLLSNLVIIVSVFIALTGISLAVIVLNGVNLSVTDINGLLSYVQVTVSVIFVFFSVGALIGAFQFKLHNKIALAVLSVFFLGFILPGFVTKLVDNNIPDISKNFKTELDGIELIIDFEDRIEKEYGKFDTSNMENERKIIESFWANECRQVLENEMKLENNLKESVSRFNDLAILTPVTFYLYTANEVSSKGYESFFKFHSYLHDVKKRFSRHYIDKRYYAERVGSKSFLEQEKVVYQAKSELPDNIGAGLVINFAYGLIFLTIAFFVNKKTLVRIESKSKFKAKNEPVALESGKILFLKLYRFKGLTDYIYGSLSGRTYPELKAKQHYDITLDAAGIPGNCGKIDFLYVCHPGDIPAELKVKDYFRFMSNLLGLSAGQKEEIKQEIQYGVSNNKTFEEMDIEEKGNIIFPVLKYCRKQVVLLAEDIAVNVSANFNVNLYNALEAWSENGAAVVYSTTSGKVTVNEEKKTGNIDYYDLPGWLTQVKFYRDVKLEEAMTNNKADEKLRSNERI